jgi:hypothetical protein
MAVATGATMVAVLYAERVLVARLCGVARRLVEIGAPRDVAIADLRSVTDRRDLLHLAVVVMTNSYPVNRAATNLLREAAGSSLRVIRGGDPTAPDAKQAR